MATTISGDKEPSLRVGSNQLHAIERLFNSERYFYHEQGANSDEQLIADKQREMHKDFFRLLIKNASDYTIFLEPAKLLHEIDEIINRIFTRDTIAIEAWDNDYIAISKNRAPMLTDGSIDDFWSYFTGIDTKRIDYNWLRDFVGMTISVYFERADTFSLKYAPIQDNVMRMTARIEAIRSHENLLETVVPRVEELHAGLSEAESRISKSAKQFQALEKRGMAIGENQETSIRNVEELTLKISNLSTVQKAALDEIRESLKLDEARELWGGFAKSAAKSFWFSFALIVVILIAFPLLAYYQRTEIIDFLKDLEISIADGSNGNGAVASTFTAFGRLLIVTAPLGFVVWLVRLLVRFNMRSMLLMDDARSRVTMLDTYLFLIGQDAAVKQDRGAILEALFRRAPGHGSDTTEPPHFTDLLRYGQEGKSNG